MASSSKYNQSYSDLFDGSVEWTFGGTVIGAPSGPNLSCDVGLNTSNSVYLYNFGFSLPSATINGITVTIYCQSASNRLDNMFVDLYDGTAVIAEQKTGKWNTNQILGNSTDIWGTSTISFLALQSSKINSSGFGLKIYGTGISSSSVIEIGGSLITIDYTPTSSNNNKFLFNIF